MYCGRARPTLYCGPWPHAKASKFEKGASDKNSLPVPPFRPTPSKCGEESGATAFCSESSREGTNILVVKGTTHTGMKDVRTKAIVITFARFGVGHLKKR